ncbi:MAG: DUF2062 domain-containing protein [Calditrichaeota bacterium]|nr:DUF2062 domain-containing protein [Calditrichota bacterium]
MKIKEFYNNKIRPKIKKGFDEIRHPGNHPRTTALSIAIGIFIGIAIPMGFQVWAMAILLLAIRYNLIIASFVSLISNPLTILPIYFAVISFGEFVLQISFPWELFYSFLDEPGFEKIVEFGTEGMFIFFTGSLLIATILSIPAYFLSFKTLTNYHNKNKTAVE